MDLYLRKVEHGQLPPEAYRVILKSDGDEIELGSISNQHAAGAQYYWKWAIDRNIGRASSAGDCSSLAVRASDRS